LILAEGGAVLVLEELGRAQARGAQIHAEVLGYGMSSDSHHVTEPDPVGGNQARSMRNAMAAAGGPPDAIGYGTAPAPPTPAAALGLTATVARATIAAAGASLS